MSKFQIKSIFEQISEPVFKIHDVEKAKQFILEFVNSKDINDKDKKLIIKNVKEAKNIAAIHRYICNSLLKYEGLGLNQLEKVKSEDKGIVEAEEGGIFPSENDQVYG